MSPFDPRLYGVSVCRTEDCALTLFSVRKTGRLDVYRVTPALTNYEHGRFDMALIPNTNMSCLLQAQVCA